LGAIVDLTKEIAALLAEKEDLEIKRGDALYFVNNSEEIFYADDTISQIELLVLQVHNALVALEADRRLRVIEIKLSQLGHSTTRH